MDPSLPATTTTLLDLRDFDATVFDSTAFTVPTDLSPFEQAKATFLFAGGFVQAFVTVDTVSVVLDFNTFRPT